MTHDDPRGAVITGMGVVSAAGLDLDTFWRRLTMGCSAVRTIERFDAAAFPSRIAAQVSDPAIDAMTAELGAAVPNDAGARGRIARFAAAATAAALRDRDAAAARPLDATDADADRVGIAFSTGMGTYGHREVFGPAARARGLDGAFDAQRFAADVRDSLEPLALERRTPGSIPAWLARHHGWRGPAMSVMTACAGGTQAIGDAIRWIRNGHADVVIAGGADSEIYPMGLASFCLLGALSTKNEKPAAASRPFDGARDGFVLGEGAAAIVLESREHARRRGARVYAEAAGFGSACDAYRVTDPHPEGQGALLAMRRAIAAAGLTADDIDYVNAHGTSTPANDRIESRALETLFGARAAGVPVNSTKSMIGHATVAAGAIEAIVCALTLVHQQLHPTINQDTPDPDCRLDYVPNRAREARVRAALSNSFAFGGQAACLVVRQAEA